MPVYADVRQRVPLHGHQDVVYTVLATPQGTLLSAGSEGIVAEWNPTTGESLGAWLQAPVALYAMGLSADGNDLLVGQADGGLHFYRRSERQVLRSVQLHTAGIYEIVWAAESWFVTSGDGSLSRWTADGIQISHLPMGIPLRGLAVQPDAEWLAVGDGSGRIHLLRGATLGEADVWPAHERTVFSLAFAPDGRHVLSAGRDAHLRLWQLGQVEQPVHDVVAHTLGIHHVSYSPDGRWIGTASMDKSWKLWSASDLTLRKVVDRRRAEAHLSSVNRLAWLPSPDPHAVMVASASDDRQVLVWTLGLRVG